MRNVLVSSSLYAALTEGAAGKGITVNELAAEILHAVVGDGPPPPRAEGSVTLQAQLLTVLLKDNGDMGVLELAQETGREADVSGREQVRYAAETLCKRGLLAKRREETEHTFYRLIAPSTGLVASTTAPHQIEGSTMPDFLDEKRQEIAARLKELEPLVEEHGRLEAAANALGGVATTSPRRGDSSTTPAAPSSRKRGRPRGSKAATTTKTVPAKAKGKSKAGRRKGGGARAAQALEFVKAQPGIKIPELAERMGIKQNYLYRVLPTLEKDGKVEKTKERGWHTVGAA